MRVFFKVLRVVLPVALLVVASGAQAQTAGDRLERLERDMMTLQRHVFQGGPAPAGGITPGTQGTMDATQYEIRLQDLTQQMQTLTGQVEELRYRLEQVIGRLNTLQSDMDFRLQRLEAAPPASTGTPTAMTPPVSSSSGQVVGTSQGNTISSGQVQDLTQMAPGQNAAPPPETLMATGKSPEQLYDSGIALVQQQRYGEAAQAFTAFLQTNAEHPLAANAHYWLAETYYVQGQYAKAAVDFANGYKKSPGGAKAPDNLLKLGLSLAQLGKSAEACKSYDKLLSAHPNAAPTLLDRARQEKQALGC